MTWVKTQWMNRSQTNRGPRGRTVRIVVALVCVALLAAGCGDSDDDGSGSETTTPTTQPAATTAAADTAAATTAAATTAAPADDEPADDESDVAAVTDYVAYVSGTAGPADDSLEPVVIGWLNQQGGQFEVGGAATLGAELAVQLANEQLGGIGGRPIEMKTCFIESDEEEGTTCGQELGNDEAVKAIVVGGVVIGIQPFFATIGGEKPVVTGVAVTPVDGVQENATVYFGSATSVLASIGTYARDVLGAETAALIYPDTPALGVGVLGIQAGLEAAGVEVEAVSYPPNQTDLIGPMTAAGAPDADIVIPYTDAGGCVNLANALTQLGIDDASKIVSAPLCLNPDVAAGLGGDYPLWTYMIASSLFGDVTDPGMLRYMELAEEYGLEAAPDPWVIVSFGTMLTTIKIINELGPDATTDEIVAALRAFSGPIALGAPELQCGKNPEAPAVCNDQSQYFTYAGQLQWEKQSSWLRPPE